MTPRLLSYILVNAFIISFSIPIDGYITKKFYFRVLAIQLLSNICAVHSAVIYYQIPLTISEFVILFVIMFFWSLRVWAYTTLGKFFSNITTPDDHILVKTGPYKVLVHPAYLGGFCTIVLGMYYLNLKWYVLLFITGYMLYFINNRIKMETRNMIIKFGDKYTDFVRSRWKFVPYIY